VIVLADTPALTRVESCEGSPRAADVVMTDTIGRFVAPFLFAPGASRGCVTAIAFAPGGVHQSTATVVSNVHVALHMMPGNLDTARVTLVLRP
jgi:hypothetical protein